MVKQSENIEDTHARRIDGTREGATFYVIDDHLFRLKLNSYKGLKLRCHAFYTHKMTSYDPPRCEIIAYLEKETMRITKVIGEHSCNQDPELAEQLSMETEMKELAVTTMEDFRDIYDTVYNKNPVVGARIPFRRMLRAMEIRRCRA